MQTKEDYILMRSARRSLVLTVDAEGRVVVRAPQKTPVADIERFILSHTAWIARRRAELARVRPDLTDGGTLCVFGIPRTIVRGNRARLAGDTLLLPSSAREEALIALLKRLSRERMGALLQEYAARYGFSYSSLRITSARGRWGSCSEKGNISFSFRTAFLSEEEARYLAVHELCHTRRMDHSLAFWKEVGAILPDFLRIRKGLRKKGAYMAFL